MNRRFQILLLATLFLGAAACKEGPRSGPIADSPTTEAREALYVVASPDAPVTVGREQAVSLQIRPAPGWKINKLFDWNFEFQQPSSASIADTTVASDKIQLDDASATIPVTLTARNEGPVELAASADFSVCNDDKCELYQDVQLNFVVPATPPSP